MIMFSSISILSIVHCYSNHIINFHSCVKISSMSFIVNHVVNFIQVTRFKPMIQFYSCDQVHPNGHLNTWISYVSLNFIHGYIILTSMSSIWEKISLSTLSNFHYLQKWTIFFFLFHHGQCQGFFIHNQFGNHL
jgi:hypothetical protein